MQPDGAAGDAVSLVNAADRVDETLPARSVDQAEIATAPSPKEEMLIPLKLTVPAPAVALAVRSTEDAPLVSVSVT